MSSPKITINLVVLNGEKYICHCLDSVINQTYDHNLIEFNIFDNGSTDGTIETVRGLEFRILDLGFTKFSLTENKENLGMWPAHEKLWQNCNSKYVVVLSVDVILDPDFIKNAVEEMEKDENLGAIQAKIYQWSLKNGQVDKTDTIDTIGFQIFKSRRLVNIGHGEFSFANGFDTAKEIFAVEGAVPVFRLEALKSCKIAEEIIDHDFFWYGDDLDIAWRMRLFGWKERYCPSVVAYHDRSTTKGVSKSWLDHFHRIKIRRQIPIKKRRLDWRNYRLAIIKNDYASNLLQDLPRVAIREIMVLGYSLLFEPQIFLEIPRLFKLLPRMLKKRKEIMSRAIVGPAEMRKWFN